MNELPEDLIFSIMLFCEDLKSVSQLLLLNRHWLSVARYEALWRMRFAFHLKKQIRDRQAEMNVPSSKKKGLAALIQKLKGQMKTHVEEAEKMYMREKIVSQKSSDHDDENSDDEPKKVFSGVDFYCGFRFYTIFKQEVHGKLVGQITFKLHELMGEKFQANTYKVVLNDTNDYILVEKSPFCQKWKQFCEYAHSHLKPFSKDHFDQEYQLQKSCSVSFMTHFQKDHSSAYSEVVSILRIFRQDTSLTKLDPKQRLDAMNDLLIQPVLELISSDKYRFPIHAFRIFNSALELNSMTLMRALMKEIEMDMLRPQHEKYFLSYPQDVEMMDYVQSQIITFLKFGYYQPEEIREILSFWITMYPSLIPQAKNTQNISHAEKSFTSDSDLLASFAMCESFRNDYYFLSTNKFSYRLLKMVIQDWKFKMSTHLAASLFRNIYHLTQNGFTINELIDIIETYEKVHEENLIDDEIAQICILSNSNLDLWKYCIDVRQGNINNMNTNTCAGIPIIYECLQSTKSSLYDLDLFEYLIEKVDVVFDKKAAVQLKVDALHHYMVRLMSKLYNLQHSTENHRWTKIFLTLFSKGSRVSEKINERTAVDLMNQYSPYLDDFSEIINNQLRREQEDQKSSSVYISLI